MKSLLMKSCASLAIVLTMATPALADSTDIRASDNAIEADVGAGMLKYGESINSTAFSTEDGWMPAFDIGGTYVTPDNSTWLPDLYLHLDGSAQFGSTAYSSSAPSQGTTNDQIYHVSAKVGRFFDVGNGFAFTPYVDLGYRSWDRQLTGPGSYGETYTNGEALGGVMFQVSPAPRLVLSASGELGSTIGPEMHVNGTGFKSGDYDLGSNTIWKLDGKIGYAFAPRFEVTGDIAWGGFGFNASTPHADGSYEPSSYTHTLTLLTGVAYHLQQ